MDTNDNIRNQSLYLKYEQSNLSQKELEREQQQKQEQQNLVEERNNKSHIRDKWNGDKK